MYWQFIQIVVLSSQSKCKEAEKDFQKSLQRVGTRWKPITLENVMFTVEQTVESQVDLYD